MEWNDKRLPQIEIAHLKMLQRYNFPLNHAKVIPGTPRRSKQLNVWPTISQILTIIYANMDTTQPLDVFDAIVASIKRFVNKNNVLTNL
jgi:hypothetical protein